MGETTKPILGSSIFFFLAPGVVAGLVPYLITHWRREAPFFGVAAWPFAGGAILAVGLFLLLDCFRRFAIEGGGTPAPVMPTRQLVASGFYCHVRNPMYVAVVSIVLGQAMLFASLPLLAYAGVVWLLFHLFVVLYEEPTLRAQFGDSYRLYQANVGRWWPRLRPWRGAQ